MEEQEFSIPFDDLGITPTEKQLHTDTFTASVYSQEVLAQATGISSGTTATAVWRNAVPGVSGWYVEAADGFGGISRSNVQYVTVVKSYDSSDSHTTTTTTTTEKNADGSTTITVTNKQSGTVTETTKMPDGTTGVVVIDKNGEVTQVQSTVSSAAITEAAKTGGAVTLPVKVPAAQNTGAAPAVEITVPKSADSVKVEIPVETVTSGTVAVIVHADGTEEIVKTSIPTKNGVTLAVKGDVTVKIIDNSKKFADVHDAHHWATDSIDFVTSRELFTGKTKDSFVPNAPTTRAQLMTVLARLDGADTSTASLQKGMEWAVENGISDGTNPSGNISRQQLAVMLWRYAGSPASDKTLTNPDAAGISDYAQSAMQWAVENGILNGTADGKLNPQGTASRAHVAAMVARYCEKLA